jgi:hypothetical protein
MLMPFLKMKRRSSKIYKSLTTILLIVTVEVFFWAFDHQVERFVGLQTQISGLFCERTSISCRIIHLGAAGSMRKIFRLHAVVETASHRRCPQPESVKTISSLGGGGALRRPVGILQK